MQITKLQSQPSHKAPEHDQSVNLSLNLSDDQKHRQMVALAKILMEIVAKKEICGQKKQDRAHFREGLQISLKYTCSVFCDKE